MIRANPSGQLPQIHKSTYVDESAVVLGNVKIGKNVFVGPLAVLRADEPGSSIEIGDDCNVQDRVIIHAFSGSKVMVGKMSSLSHGSIVHGPCVIGKGCFIGFGSVVVNSTLGDNTVTEHLKLLENVDIAGNRKMSDLAQRVLKANRALTKGYKKYRQTF